jgi:hypothetical protein
MFAATYHLNRDLHVRDGWYKLNQFV